MPRSAAGSRRASGLLALALAVEIALFALVAPNFSTVGNAFEVLRLSVELGLLAIALTPVIVSGGIDLSVGSMLGLSAVVFGIVSRDLGVPMPGRGVAALARRRRSAGR